jgi:hypothetical protein
MEEKDRGVLIRQTGTYLQNQDTPQDRYALWSICCTLKPWQLAGILLRQPDLKFNNQDKQGIVSMVLAKSTLFFPQKICSLQFNYQSA